MRVPSGTSMAKGPSTRACRAGVVGVRKAKTEASAVRRRRVFICVFLLNAASKSRTEKRLAKVPLFSFPVMFEVCRLANAEASCAKVTTATGRTASGLIGFGLHFGDPEIALSGVPAPKAPARESIRSSGLKDRVT